MNAYIISELATDRHRTLLAEAEAHRLARAVAEMPALRQGRRGWFRQHWPARTVAHH